MPTTVLRLLVSAMFVVLALAGCDDNAAAPSPRPVAGFTTGCTAIVDSLLEFIDHSKNATSWAWDFGDGRSSTEQSPALRFTASGEFVVTQVAGNDRGERDTLRRTITIHPPIPERRVLNIPLVELDTSFGGWAAVVTTAIGADSVVRQCDVPARLFALDCCGNPGDCEIPITANDITESLARFRYATEVSYAPLSVERIRAEIAQGRPVIAYYTRGPRFTLQLIYGYDAAENFFVYDPYNGSVSVPYENLLRIGNQGTFFEWSLTFYCIHR